MSPHIDEFGRLLDSAKCGFHCSLGTAHKSYHGPIRTRAGIDIEQRNAFHGPNRVGDLPNHIQIAAFRKIRHALDQFLHDIHWNVFVF